MRKSILTLFLSFILFVVLAGCGEKSQEEVLDALDEKAAKMNSYKTEVSMTLESGEKPQTYRAEIWYKEPSYYRVKLENESKEQSQIILRNDEGVFVLTPALNKNFRFQSDWPENNSQIYLYQSLINDILTDTARTVTVDKEDYVFNTKTNYQNKNLYQQEITLSKKSLSPKMVKVMDQDMNVLVTAEFSNVEFDAEFDDDAFDMERNMTSAKLDIPTTSMQEEAFDVFYPLYTAETNLAEENEVVREGERQIVLTYTGDDHSFTLIQQRASIAAEASAPVHYVDGEPVDLGVTVGVMTGNAITWSHEGVDLFLTSNDMDQEEMMAVARSVQSAAIK